MRNILIQQLASVPVGHQPMEYVERKGVGHPDTICDSIMDSVSIALSRAYLEVAGQVLHHNLDKGLLVAGQSSPCLGGGKVDAPIRLIFGDRATTQWQGSRIPVAEIAETAASRWLREHLRFIDPAQHVVFQNEMWPGATELVDLFARSGEIGANDTSVAVGYAPMTETEHLVLAAERRLNSPEFKALFPEAGEDIKVLGVRQGRQLNLTIALAFVDRFIPDEQSYFQRKEAIRTDLQRFLARSLKNLDSVGVALNTLDQPGRGLGGMYLTVLGTSAEGGDSGQVGRGNRVNGISSLTRPMSTEAAAGKNPVNHVGKVYNLLSYRLADLIYASVEGIEEVYVWLCSQIGKPLDQPWVASTQLGLVPGANLSDVEATAREVIDHELANIQAFTAELIRGEISVC